MKKLLVVFVLLLLCLCSCGQEKVEGNALEKYLEIIDTLPSGVVNMTTTAANTATTVYFKETEQGCKILATTKSKTASYTNYFDGTYLYSGSGELEKHEDELDSATVKRSLVGAPDYAIDADWYDEEASGIYKTLTGYKIIIVTHSAEDEVTDNPDTTLTMTLDGNMVPKKTVIEDEIFEADGGTTIYKTTITYSNIGADIGFQSGLVSE